MQFFLANIAAERLSGTSTTQPARTQQATTQQTAADARVNTPAPVLTGAR